MTSLAEQIRDVRFTPVRMREGYDMAEVDQFLDQLVAADAAGEPIAPLIREVRFTPVRLREGYAMDEVDHFLETISGDNPKRPTPARRSTTSTTVSHGDSVIQERRSLMSRIFGR